MVEQSEIDGGGDGKGEWCSTAEWGTDWRKESVSLREEGEKEEEGEVIGGGRGI